MAARTVTGVYAVTPEVDTTADLLARVTSVLAAGAQIVQYRSKHATYAVQREQISSLLPCVRRFGASLIVNDSPELAAEVGADGVHLGSEDGSIESARSLLGPDRLIGMSCYNELERARMAQMAGADYVAFGSFFPSPTKPTAVRADAELLRRAKAELDVPLVAIGGINKCNAAPLIRAGADALAIISAIFESDEIEQDTRAFLRLFALSESATQHS